MSSLAAVFHGTGKLFTLERFALPQLKDSEVLVRITCATICGSDLHTCFGRRQAPVPSILGNEMVGEITEVGPLSSWKVGERVTWSMVWSCGDCYYCNRKLVQKCVRLMKFGHEAITEGHALLGGLAEYFAGCRSARRSFECRTGSAILACPANCAPATVIVIEPNDAWRELARRFGATSIEWKPGEADVVFELSGQAESVELGFEIAQGWVVCAAGSGVANEGG